MTRLLIHVEGQTEETFVNEVLAPHLYGCGYTMVGARLLGNARQRSRRGGIRPWGVVRKDIIIPLMDDRESLATIMVDYYALPGTGHGAWPGRDAARALAFENRAGEVQQGMLADVCDAYDGDFDPSRFVPYVIMHEFEGLLFSDCARFAEGLNEPGLASAFQKIRDAFDTPEEINDSPHTAPSKRVLALLPGYQKPLLGTLAALHVGLAAIREECPNFSAWLTSLEDRVA